MIKNNPESADSENKRIRVDVDKAWSALRGRLETDGLIPEKETISIRFLPPVLRMAAAIVLMVALSATAYFILSSRNDQMRLTAQTDMAEEYGLSLPDGSVVDLNTNSKIQFSQDKSGNRLVKLSGEAFFEVSHDPGRSFIITSGQAVVRVIGTSFSVRSDPAGTHIEVFVKSGSVQFYQAGEDGNMIKLESGNMGILENNVLRMEDNHYENYLSWKTRKLTFRQANLGEVAKALNRTYKKEILFGNDALKECLYTGTFDAQPVDSVIRVLQLTFNLDVDQHMNSYVLSGEACN